MMENNEKKYLSLPKKIAYGSGDFGSNFFYMIVSSFALIYLTDAIGLNPGVVGTLMMVSKLLDGFTDVIFGRLIDNTRSKMGKARPWMFWSAFPLALCLILMFAVPSSMTQVGQYAFFFVFYTAANALFYTANNIAYATMSALITKNNTERVQLGSFRYIFAVLAAIIVSSVTIILVDTLGGGVVGWRNVAIIYAIIQLVFSSIASLTCKEILETDMEMEVNAENKLVTKKESLVDLLKSVLSNKYYRYMLAIYVLMYTTSGIGMGMGIFYCTYILGSAALLGVISLSSFVIIIGLMANPILVKKYGMYKVNLISYGLTSIFLVGFLIAVYAGSLLGIVIFALLKGITMAPLLGSLNAIVAEVSTYNFYTKKVHAEGMMFSCSSVGLKVGSGLGTAISGWLLSAAGYIGSAEVQSIAVINVIKFGYGALPLILTILITFCLWKLKVVEENKKFAAKNLA